jgi:type I restriction enzyme M protein
MVVPESFLFRRGRDTELRRRLLNDYAVESVWSLPKGAFLPSTSLKTSVIVIRRETPPPSVVFVSDRLTQSILMSTDKQEAIGVGGTSGGKSQILPALVGARFLVGPIAAAVGTAAVAGVVGPTTLAVLTGLVALRKWRSRGERDFLATWQAWRNAAAHGRNLPDSSELSGSFGPGIEEDVRVVPVDDLAKRGWELVSKATGANELESFLHLIKSQIGPVELVRLDEVAEVFSGISYKSGQLIRVSDGALDPTADSPATFVQDTAEEDANVVALIRVQDVSPRKRESDKSGRVRRPNTFLRREGVARIARPHRLIAGDLLLTRSGSVGHVALIDETLVGAVPANGLIVIRPNRGYDPLALLRLLHTGPYQDWFRGSASGSIIQHLSTRAVKDLSVPALTFEQQRYLANSLHLRGDADAVLAAFRNMSGESLWITFLLNDSAVASLLEAGNGTGYSPEWWRALRQTVDRCRRIQMESQTEDDQFGHYMATWLQHSLSLLDTMDLPPGLERYAALKDWDKWATQELWRTKDRGQTNQSIDGIRSGATSRFHALCELLMGAASTEADRVANSATAEVSLRNTTLFLETPSELQISLVNGGMGPLRKVEVRIEELNVHNCVPLLRAEQSATVVFAFTPTQLGKQQLRVQWSAERINGSKAGGTEQISFEVKRSVPQSAIDPFRLNPYVTGAPVDTDETFFGRHDIIQNIQRLLRPDGPSTVILLEGNRRAGKTSILKRLQRSELLDDWVPVYCQFQGISGEPNAQSLYRLVARELLYSVTSSPVDSLPDSLREISMADALRRKTLCRELAATIEDQRPFEQFESLLELALAAIGSRRILLMLDEFEKIHQGIEQQQMSPLVPENFRYLFHTYERVSGILSGSIRIKKLRKEYWNVLFGIGTPIPVGPLSASAAREVVVRPVRGVLSYSDNAVDRLLELCAYQPFLVQSLASSIFESCAAANLTSITTEFVNKSAESLVLNNEHFQTIFRQQSLTARQRFLTCLIDHLTDAPARVTFDVISDQMEANSIPVESDSRLKEDLEELQEQEIVRFVPEAPGGHYRIEVPLFSRWLRAKVDFQAARREAIEE